MADRRRWNGFIIGDDEIDQAVAGWLDLVADDPKVNVSKIVKTHLYQIATGQLPLDPAQQTILAALESIAAHLDDHNRQLDQLAREIRRIASGVVIAPNGAAPVPEDELAEIERRLGSLPD